MQDSVLHLLTNRSADFGNIIFPIISSYVPHQEGVVESELRTFLKLRSGDPAYYLLGVISAIHAFPEVYEEFKETDFTYELVNYQRPVDTVVGGAFKNAYGKVFNISRRPKSFPVSFDIVVNYKDSSQVRIYIGEDSYDVDYIIRNTHDLDIDWPVESGISGILTPYSTWTQGAAVIATNQPVSYPYEAVAAEVLKNTSYIKFLSELSLLKNMYSAQSAIEKVAILALAISNPTVYAR